MIRYQVYLVLAYLNIAMHNDTFFYFLQFKSTCIGINKTFPNIFICA